jgi:hypothetical protein
MGILWNPANHSDQENLQWSWLRAVEWSRWPLFVSLPVAPLLLLVFNALTIAATFFAVNLLWAVVRYRYVSAPLASVGAVLALARWLTGPIAAVLLFRSGTWVPALLALLWPAVVPILGAMTPAKIGRIQAEFMRQLGYEPSSVNPLGA